MKLRIAYVGTRSCGSDNARLASLFRTGAGLGTAARQVRKRQLDNNKPGGVDSTTTNRGASHMHDCKEEVEYFCSASRADEMKADVVKLKEHIRWPIINRRKAKA